ncbi:a-type inclusion protein [Anaeramoeba flamelloides]|uniref:A-type inclusion protein n=1 Tax=Anaeramoeba flamelloides TaxID=1746091 RepID=A0ABQ8Z1D6_9EUKA|nr:a-type inclusion protein [Anaeramoeba flamelloides]
MSQNPEECLDFVRTVLPKTNLNLDDLFTSQGIVLCCILNKFIPTKKLEAVVATTLEWKSNSNYSEYCRTLIQELGYPEESIFDVQLLLNDQEESKAQLLETIFFLKQRITTKGIVHCSRECRTIFVSSSKEFDQYKKILKLKLLGSVTENHFFKQKVGDLKLINKYEKKKKKKKSTSGKKINKEEGFDQDNQRKEQERGREQEKEQQVFERNNTKNEYPAQRSKRLKNVINNFTNLQTNKKSQYKKEKVKDKVKVESKEKERNKKRLKKKLPKKDLNEEEKEKKEEQEQEEQEEQEEKKQEEQEQEQEKKHETKRKKEQLTIIQNQKTTKKKKLHRSRSSPRNKSRRRKKSKSRLTKSINSESDFSEKTKKIKRRKKEENKNQDKKKKEKRQRSRTYYGENSYRIKFKNFKKNNGFINKKQTSSKKKKKKSIRGWKAKERDLSKEPNFQRLLILHISTGWKYFNKKTFIKYCDKNIYKTEYKVIKSAFQDAKKWTRLKSGEIPIKVCLYSPEISLENFAIVDITSDKQRWRSGKIFFNKNSFRIITGKQNPINEFQQKWKTNLVCCHHNIDHNVLLFGKKKKNIILRTSNFHGKLIIIFLWIIYTFKKNYKNIINKNPPVKDVNVDQINFSILPPMISPNRNLKKLYSCWELVSGLGSTPSESMKCATESYWTNKGVNFLVHNVINHTVPFQVGYLKIRKMGIIIGHGNKDTDGFTYSSSFTISEFQINDSLFQLEGLTSNHKIRQMKFLAKSPEEKILIINTIQTFLRKNKNKIELLINNFKSTEYDSSDLEGKEKQLNQNL